MSRKCGYIIVTKLCKYMKLNELSNNPGSKRDKKRVGRGIGSGKGKTCGRGVKGQKARAGVSIKWFEGGQTPLIRRVPKRGFRSHNEAYEVVHLSDINRLIENGSIEEGRVITKKVLVECGLVNGGKIKLLGSDALSKSLAFGLHGYSKSAREAIVNSNGTIVPKKPKEKKPKEKKTRKEKKAEKKKLGIK